MLRRLPARSGALALVFALALPGLTAAALADGAPPGGAAAAKEPVAYAIDPQASSFRIDVRKAGFFSGLGHAHVVTASALTGTIAYDPAAPERGSVRFELPASALRVSDPGIDEDDRAEIQRNMEREVLELRKHPSISFASTGAAPVPGAPDTLRVRGDLTLHGATRPVTIDVKLARAADGALVATGATEILQTDFGIEPFSVGLGAVKVADPLGIAFEVRARRAPEARR